MSRTDKTDPYWVQIRDPGCRWPVIERHYHHGCFGTTQECDLDYPVPRSRRRGFKTCEYDFRYIGNDKVYGRPRFRRSYGSFQDRRVRMDLRRLRAKWLREPIRGDIDSTENLPTSRWRWRHWYWD